MDNIPTRVDICSDIIKIVIAHNPIPWYCVNKQYQQVAIPHILKLDWVQQKWNSGIIVQRATKINNYEMLNLFLLGNYTIGNIDTRNIGLLTQCLKYKRNVGVSDIIRHINRLDYKLYSHVNICKELDFANPPMFDTYTYRRQCGVIIYAPLDYINTLPLNEDTYILKCIPLIHNYIVNGGELPDLTGLLDSIMRYAVVKRATLITPQTSTRICDIIDLLFPVLDIDILTLSSWDKSWSYNRLVFDLILLHNKQILMRLAENTKHHRVILTSVIRVIDTSIEEERLNFVADYLRSVDKWHVDKEHFASYYHDEIFRHARLW